MSSGSSDGAASTSSYTVADVREPSDWQKTVQKTLKAEQMRVLLRTKGITPKGLKPDLAQTVAWNFTKAEVDEWLAQQESALQPPALLASRPSQPTVNDFFGKK